MEEKEQRQLLMDLDVVMRANDCKYIVHFYGALFKEVCLCFQVQYIFNYFSHIRAIYIYYV